MKAYLTIEVDLHEVVEAVRAYKFKGVTREWCTDSQKWVYEPLFEMPPRIAGYPIEEYSPELEDMVAETLVAEWREVA